MPLDPDSLLSPDAGRGTGVEYFAGNYPFVRPSSNVRGLLADLWFCHEDPNVTGPLAVTALYHFGRPLSLEVAGPPEEHQCDIVISAVGGGVVCDTRDADYYTGRPFGNRFYVHEWRLEDRVCRVVQHTKIAVLLGEVLRELENDDIRDTENDVNRLLEQLGNPIPEVLVPDNGELDERTHERLPGRLLSVAVGGVVLRGSIVLVAGYNMQIDSGSAVKLSLPDLVSPSLTRGVGTSLRLTESRIFLAAVAGAGDGQAPGCGGGESGLRSINNVPPTQAGNFLLGGVACIDVSQPPLAGRPLELTSATLQLGNHCRACCDCADYVAAYKRIRVVHNRLQQTAQLAEQTRDLYHSLLDRWTASKTRCEAMPLDVEVLGAKFVRTFPPPPPPDPLPPPFCVTYVTISAMVGNTSDNCLYDVVLTLSCTFVGIGSVLILNGSNFQTLDSGDTITAVVGGGWPVYTVHWDRIATNQSVRVQFTLAWSGTDSPSGEFRVDATATASGATLPIGGDEQTASDITQVDTQVF